MGIVLTISPHGRLLVPASASEPPFPGDPFCERIREAFAKSQAHGLLHLATRELTSALSPEFGWARDFASRYLTRLCHSPEIAGTSQLHATPVPEPEDLAAMAESAPPMRGREYLQTSLLADWWSDLDGLVRQEVRELGQSVQDYLHQLNPAWRTVGRVAFHLAENKRAPDYPFAFLATYVTRLSAQLAGRFGGGSPGLRLALALEIKRHCCADEILQYRLIDLVAFVDVDGAPNISVEAGIEQTGRVFYRSSPGKGHLDVVFVRLCRADDAAAGEDGSSHPLHRFDDLRVCRVDDGTHFRERLPPPVSKFVDLRVDKCRGRLRGGGPFHVQLQVSHRI